MPISKENRHLYPPDWKEISNRIRFERAKGKCEKCGVAHLSEGYRDKDGNFIDYMEVFESLENTGYDYFEHELSHIGPDQKMIKIVLTTAHIDHDPTNNDESNLLALCQRCHLAMDQTEHRINARNTRNRKKKQLSLF